MKLLECCDLKVSYTRRSRGERVLIEGLNAHFEEGGLYVLIGVNGAGKSSLLRVMAGVQAAAQGCVRLSAADVMHMRRVERSRSIAALFRDFSRVDGMLVRDMVALGRHPYTGLWGSMRAEDESAVEEAMEAVGMMDFAERQVSTLSDGEFQKALLAKMLAQDAPVMLLDEPDSHLDLPSALEMVELLRKLASAQGKCIIISTHNLPIAFQMADKVLLLEGQGKWAFDSPAAIAGHALMCGFLRSDKIAFVNGELTFKLNKT